MTPARTVAGGRRWSLANRLAWWVFLVTVTPGLVAVLVGGWFLQFSLTRELESLMVEEAAESLTAIGGAERPVEAFREASRKLQGEHPETPMGWRLLDASTSTVLGEYGQRQLLEPVSPAVLPLDRTVDLGRGRLGRAFDAAPPLRFQLVIDGDQRSRSVFNFYALAAGALMVITSVIALCAGRLLARRVAGLLRQVADDVHTSGDRQRSLSPAARLPDEIHDVVDSLQAELLQIRQEAEKVRLFTAGLAHELRSPLQNLISQAEVTLLRSREPANYAAVLASQLEELNELSDAVDNLLTMCTVQPAAHGRAGEEFDLHSEAALRLQRERVRAEREGVELQMEARGATRLVGDREGVLRGIRNVVANAIDWTPRGGRVRVSIEGTATAIDVTVDDSGPGVPPELRSRIFEPFFQGNGQLRKRSGYGLGLAIAAAAVAGHDGSIDVGTSAFGGARFRMVFRSRAVGRDGRAG